MILEFISSTADLVSLFNFVKNMFEEDSPEYTEARESLAYLKSTSDSADVALQKIGLPSYGALDSLSLSPLAFKLYFFSPVVTYLKEYDGVSEINYGKLLDTIIERIVKEAVFHNVVSYGHIGITPDEGKTKFLVEDVNYKQRNYFENVTTEKRLISLLSNKFGVNVQLRVHLSGKEHLMSMRTFHLYSPQASFAKLHFYRQPYAAYLKDRSWLYDKKLIYKYVSNKFRPFSFGNSMHVDAEFFTIIAPLIVDTFYGDFKNQNRKSKVRKAEAGMVLSGLSELSSKN